MNQIFENNFFVITSENIHSIHCSRIYGYCLYGTKGYKNSEIPVDLAESLVQHGIGSFHLVCKEQDTISILSDKSHTVILYFFQEGDYWAISNCFWKLCEEVSKKHSLHIDEGYAVSMINASMSSVSVKNTYAKEIKMIPYDMDVKIDSLGKVHFVECKMDIATVPIHSIEALDIIDHWIEKWGNVFYSIVRQGCPLTVDLTGGFDSRVTFALLNATADLKADNVRIKTFLPVNAGEIEHDNGDYAIAQKITQSLGYAHNKGFIGEETVPISFKDAFELNWNILLPQHSESGHIREEFFLKPSFQVGGLYGEPVRGAFQGMDKWLSQVDRRGLRDFDILAYGEVLDSYDYVKKNIMRDESLDEYVAWVKFFCATWNRNHFGSLSFQGSCLNNYYISPLSDYDLLKIAPLSGERDNDLLYALIIMRLSPELMNYPFAGGQKFKESTIIEASKINEMKPKKVELTETQYELSSFAGEYHDDGNVDLKYPLEALELIFNDIKNQERFIRHFGKLGKNLLEKAYKEYTDKNRRFSHSAITAIASVMQLLKYGESEEKEQEEFSIDYQKLYESYQKYPNKRRICLRDAFYKLYMRLSELKVNRIALYGAGRMGWLFYEFIYDTPIQVVCLIDQQQGKKLGNMESVRLEDVSTEKFDMIVISLIEEADEIMACLENNGLGDKTIALKTYIER